MTTRPELVGGLYGVAIGGFFGGESMFHRRTDASKAALVALVELLNEGGGEEARFIDVQWLTPHLASLGAVEISCAEYLDRLEQRARSPASRPRLPLFGVRKRERLLAHAD